MSRSCVDPAEIPEQLALPVADPRRAHLDRCPRCEALAANFREFVAPSTAPSAADRQDADQRLRATLVRHGGPPPLPSVSAGASAGAPRAGAAEPGRRKANPSRRRPHGRIAPPRWRWAAIGAAAAVLVAVVSLRPQEPRIGSTVLREQPGSSTGTPGAAAPVLETPLAIDGQGIQLRWSPVAQADAYQVVLYSVAMVEVASLGPQAEASVILTRQGVPATIPAGTPLLVRVVALRQGAPLGTSRATSLLTPP